MLLLSGSVGATTFFLVALVGLLPDVADKGRSPVADCGLFSVVFSPPLASFGLLSLSFISYIIQELKTHFVFGIKAEIERSK